MFRFDIICREYRRLSRNDGLKKYHVMKYMLVSNELKRKLGVNEKQIMLEYFKTQSEVLDILLRKNIQLDSNPNQHQIVAVVESLIELFNKEPHLIHFMNVIDFQDVVTLLFAFFLKISNNNHKLYIDFCK